MDVTCLCCGMMEEDTAHILFKCDFARMCRSKSGIAISNFNSNGWDGSNLIFSFLGRLSVNDKDRGSMVLWLLWNNINSIVFEGRGRELEFVALTANTPLARFKDA